MKCPIDYAEREHAHQCGEDQLLADEIDALLDEMFEARHSAVEDAVWEFAEAHGLNERFVEDWFADDRLARALLTVTDVEELVLPVAQALLLEMEGGQDDYDMYAD